MMCTGPRVMSPLSRSQARPSAMSTHAFAVAVHGVPGTSATLARVVVVLGATVAFAVDGVFVAPPRVPPAGAGAAAGAGTAAGTAAGAGPAAGSSAASAPGSGPVGLPSPPRTTAPTTTSAVVTTAPSRAAP